MFLLVISFTYTPKMFKNLNPKLHIYEHNHPWSLKKSECPKTSSDIIEKTIRYLNVKLPQDYLDFLKSYNFLGFYWLDEANQPNIPSISFIENGEVAYESVFMFSGTCDFEEVEDAVIFKESEIDDSLLSRAAVYRDWFQDTQVELLPICNANAGDFCFIVNEDRTLGPIVRIFFDDVAWDLDKKEMEKSFPIVANSFTEFIGKITPEDSAIL